MTDLSPTPLVKVGYQVVKAINHRLILLLSVLDTLLRGDLPSFFSCSAKEILIVSHRLFNLLTLEDRISVGQHFEAAEEVAKSVALSIAFERSRNTESNVHSKQRNTSNANRRNGAVLKHGLKHHCMSSLPPTCKIREFCGMMNPTLKSRRLNLCLFGKKQQ